VRLLLDTCTFIWLTSESERIDAAARAALDLPDADLVLSEASVWEISLKWQAGKLSLPTPPRLWIETQAEAWQLRRLPVGREHVYQTTELPDVHRDPFDRLLVAQAIEGGLTIVTPDPLIRRYPVAVLW
jgi:PIN domain nuclease of toxin-antitoxin system